MASLMENLMDILEQENIEYKTLLDLSMKKTSIIVSHDIVALSAITEEEQKQVDRINALDRQRSEVMADIANVMNMDVQTLKLGKIIDILAARSGTRTRTLVYRAADFKSAASAISPSWRFRILYHKKRVIHQRK